MPDRPLLIIGDSITDADRRTDADHLGFGWVRAAAETLKERGDTRHIVNTGISGHRVPDLLARWDTDALDYEPSVLTIYIGINDVWRAFDSADPTSTQAFELGYRQLLDRAVAAGVPSIILIEPFLTPATDEQRTEWPADLDPKREVVRRLAEEYEVTYVPLHERMNAAAAEQGVDAIAGDGVHPAPAGAHIIADAWLEGLAKV